MVGSCNGLVCHYLNNQVTKGYCGGICNPVTGEYLVIPRPRRPKYAGWFVLGFGYLPSTNEYKVVRCCYEWLNGGWKGYVEVCTLGSQSGWRGQENIPYTIFLSQSGLFVNGAIHWICETVRKMCKIVAYDLSDEKFKNVSSPPFDFFKRHDGVSGRLELLGGNLCAIVYGRDEILVWALKRNTKNARILRPRSTDYDNITSTLTKLWERDGKTLSCLQAIPHMNTLVSLKDIVERSGNNATSDNGESLGSKISRKRKRRKYQCMKKGRKGLSPFVN
ncbi:F-box protein At3g07870-like [Papaver somniferum]|uniref:F-box protein At3g07870-like n=1 Tax=Papaver somniferum TaxID=3469 RepID=UPI000E70092A|nr:F-box protein At3g07870-like [Papaver somniferum]